MDFIENLLKLRVIADPLLIARNNLYFDVLAAAVGLITGLVIAYIIWHRSAHFLEALEAEGQQLRKGDIDIHGGREIATARTTGETLSSAKTSSGAPQVLATAEPKQTKVAMTPPITKVVQPEPPSAAARPDDADDLTVLEGITEERAAELNRAGIYKISQLANMGEEDRRKFAFKFGWPDINWGAWTAAAAFAPGAVINRPSNISPQQPVGVQLNTESIRSDEAVVEAVPLAAGAGTPDPHPWPNAAEWGKNWISRVLAIPMAGAGAMANYYQSRFQPLPEVPKPIEASPWTRDWPRRGLDSLSAASKEMPTYYSEREHSAQKRSAMVEDPKEPELAIERKETESAGDDHFIPTPFFDSAPEDADDLTLLEGIDPQRAAELNRAGIFKFSQLENMDEEQKVRFARRFKWPDINWGRWTSLGLIGAATAGGVAELLGKDGDGGETHAGSSQNPSESPAVEPDWTWVTSPENEMDLEQLPELQGEDLERLRAEGITTAQQLASLPESKRSEIGSNFEWGDIDWGKWGTVGALGSAGVAAMSNFGQNPASSPDQEISAKARPLESVKREEGRDDDTLPISPLTVVTNDVSPPEINRADDTLPIPPLTVSMNDVPSFKVDREDDTLPIVAPLAVAMVETPTVTNDRADDTYTVTESVAVATGPAPAEEVGHEDQTLTSAPIEVGADHPMGLNDGKADATPAIAPMITAPFVVDASGKNTGAAQPDGNPEERGDDTIPIEPSASLPSHVRAVDNGANETRTGSQHWTWNYKTVENSAPAVKPSSDVAAPSLPSPNVAKGKTGWGDIEWSKWASVDSAAVAAPTLTASALSSETPATSPQAVWQTEAEAGREIPKINPVDASLVSPASDPRLGNIFLSQPDVVDDLTEINGIGLATESKLNRLGIYTFGQIAQWDENAIMAVEELLGSPGCVGRDQWVAQARDFIGAQAPAFEAEPERPERSAYLSVLQLFKGEDVVIDENFGVVYKTAPAASDDLKQIKGVGKQIENQLAEKGIFRLNQIAHWNDYNVWAFGQALGFPGKITREEWVSQAKALLANAVGSKESSPGPATIPHLVTPAIAPISAALAAVPQASSAVFADLELEGGPRGIFGTGDAAAIGQQERVVYIMDVSRSLTPAQLRLSKMELASAITSLPADALYQVIFFSGPSWFANQRMVEGGARGEDVIIKDGDIHYKWISSFGGFEFEHGNENLPSANWLPATRENINSTLKDIEEVGKSYGTTWHLPLTMALNLEPAPKTIYFLTDGETARQEQVAEDMVELARQRGENTRIHTIALMVPGASVPLHRIAKGTGGHFCLVIAGGKVLKDAELLDYLADKDIALDL